MLDPVRRKRLDDLRVAADLCEQNGFRAAASVLRLEGMVGLEELEHIEARRVKRWSYAVSITTEHLIDETFMPLVFGIEKFLREASMEGAPALIEPMIVCSDRDERGIISFRFSWLWPDQFDPEAHREQALQRALRREEREARQRDSSFWRGAGSGYSPRQG